MEIVHGANQRIGKIAMRATNAKTTRGLRSSKPAAAVKPRRVAGGVSAKAVKNTDADISALLDELTPKQAKAALAAFLQTLVGKQHADDMSDVETPKTRRRSRTSADEEEDEAPVRKVRRATAAKKEEAVPTRRSRAVKVDLPDDMTFEGLTDWMDTLEIVPVAGGIRELKPKVEEWGADWNELTSDGEDRASKATIGGNFLAVMETAYKALLKADPDDIEALLEELGIEEDGKMSAKVKAILIEINSIGDNDEEDPDGEDEEEADPEDDDLDPDGEDEAEDEAEVDELDDIEDDVQPKRRSRR